MALYTSKFRLSFPYLAEQRKNMQTNEPAGYGCQAIIKKSDVTPEFQKEFRGIIKQALIKKFGDNVPGKIKELMKRNPLYPMRDGDDKAQFDTWREEYTGCWVTNLNSGKYAPGCLVKRLGDKALSKEEVIAEFYPGCYCIATINAYAYDTNGNKGASIGLQNILKVSDGEPLGATKASAANDFEDLLDEADDDEDVSSDDFEEDDDWN
jgi:hypothetical protein